MDVDDSGTRLGTFFLLVGLLGLGLFIFSDRAGSPDYRYLLGGGLLAALGIFLRLRNPAPPPQPADRFHSLRSMGKKEKKPDKPKAPANAGKGPAPAASPSQGKAGTGGGGGGPGGGGGSSPGGGSSSGGGKSGGKGLFGIGGKGPKGKK